MRRHGLNIPAVCSDSLHPIKTSDPAAGRDLFKPQLGSQCGDMSHFGHSAWLSLSADPASSQRRCCAQGPPPCWPTLPTPRLPKQPPSCHVIIVFVCTHSAHTMKLMIMLLISLLLATGVEGYKE